MLLSRITFILHCKSLWIAFGLYERSHKACFVVSDVSRWRWCYVCRCECCPPLQVSREDHCRAQHSFHSSHRLCCACSHTEGSPAQTSRSSSSNKTRVKFTLIVTRLQVENLTLSWRFVQVSCIQTGVLMQPSLGQSFCWHVPGWCWRVGHCVSPADTGWHVHGTDSCPSPSSPAGRKICSKTSLADEAPHPTQWAWLEAPWSQTFLLTKDSVSCRLELDTSDHDHDVIID